MSTLSLTELHSPTYSETSNASMEQTAVPRKAPLRWIAGMTPARALGIVCVFLTLLVTVLSLVVGILVIHASGSSARFDHQDERINNLGTSLLTKQSQINQLKQEVTFLEMRIK